MNSNESFDRTASHMAGEYVSYNEPVAWMNSKGDIILPAMQANKEYNIPLYTHPAKYCPSENNEAYEKGFIDGMAKQRDSAVQQMVEANSHPVKEHDIGISHAIGFDYGFKPTQLKELTDEEIKSEAKYLCHGWHSENPERLVLFARAILRKVQEK